MERACGEWSPSGGGKAGVKRPSSLARRAGCGGAVFPPFPSEAALPDY